LCLVENENEKNHEYGENGERNQYRVMKTLYTKTSSHSFFTSRGEEKKLINFQKMNFYNSRREHHILILERLKMGRRKYNNPYDSINSLWIHILYMIC